MAELDTKASRAGSTAPATQADGASIGEFLAFHGGPFYGLQGRLRLLSESSLQSGRRAILFVTLAWAVPFMLGLPGGFWPDHSEGAYLGDLGVWAKFFIAVSCFILAEKQVERGLKTKLLSFTRAPIIAPVSTPQAAGIVAQALRRRDSRLAEAVCLALAVSASYLSYSNLHTVDASSWAVDRLSEGNRITAAGWWSIFFSLPLFVFLFVRFIWRHLVCAQLLRGIAKLQLRLVATHPDCKAGLGFLAHFPNAYSYFVFGMSCAVAAAVAKNLLQEGLSFTTFSMVMSGWLALIVAFFAYPLSAFTLPLYRLKQRGLALLGAQATQYFRSVERETLGRNVFADSTPEQEVDLPDTGKLFESTRKLSTVLISRTAVVPVATAALIPFAVAGATKLPYKEVVSVLKKLLFL